MNAHAQSDNPAPPDSFRARAGRWIESPRIQNLIVAIIVLNAITLGLDTFEVVQVHAGSVLQWIERTVLTIFVFEIAVKLYAFGFRFFRSGWNVFDFLIVAVSLLPGTGAFSVLRTLRILRVLRLLTKIKRLRHVVDSLLRAIPGIGWIAVLLMLVFYVFAVMGTRLFADSFPEYFGHLGRSMYSLFQVMTLESWSQEISRPVMAVYPYAWIYFLAFIMLTAFTVLNLFIGIIVNSMQEQHYEEEENRRQEQDAAAREERDELMAKLQEINDRLARLESSGRTPPT
ncbi:voltage-gated sodium channel [Ectothiorhodospira haloalkaliphila]|uniref:Voltage-gated sodium channel n=1 Tax=Ectothiorhodospira haloalkaliphila TaxID=421628 RepID=W8KKZ8_9GAMM|nr:MULTISPECIES: ion transporter [Ectothiorhodospira]AHK80479.1 voltage-gated sodium channel [Ectothiorhodospira haloalkaliphila]MCG5494290.1 ion transporter [Ectothiorhodospira variabilis]MCG5496455.1 ion transporter [Ectothiorhodospira variabilis]MCG5504057.1 ion transporter [Ectothiorhodospira variabilis]MCG5507212.1 ion transporter [Ectothiorhodospira variabilis]